MGQNVSQPRRGPAESAQSLQHRDERPRWRHSSLGTFVRNLESHSHSHAESGEDAGGLLNENAVSASHARSRNTHRLSRLLSPSSNDNTIPSTPHRSALQRSRSTLNSIFRRDSAHQTTSRGTHRPHGILQRRTSYLRTAGRDSSDGQDFYQPRLPSIDQSSIFDQDMFSRSEERPPSSSQSNSRSNNRFGLRRPERRLSFRHYTDARPLGRLQSAFRRRPRSPPPSSRRAGGSEDQAVLLSQLLSAAAAATAATLMGDDHHALNEARSLSVGTGIGELGGSGEDGSFDGFLRALQSGRIASALRQSGEAAEGADASSQNGPLNFFRMFRFGSSNATADNSEPSQAAGEDAAEPNAHDGRMIPIIIVGIRSISPNSNSGAPADDLPPFLDALTNFAAPTQEDDLNTLNHNSIDSILRPPHNGTSFRHRRRASMGGFGMSRNRIVDRYDDQRDHRSPDRRRDRPWSIASSMSEPRPPPATPASPSPELSRIPSRNSTPSQSRPASFIANSIRELAGESRRNSVLHRSASSPLAIHAEEAISVHSTHSSDNLLQQAEQRWDNPTRRVDNAPHVHYPRFASGHPRRNGVVEPDNLPSLSRPSTSTADGGARSSNETRNDSRSWIIYVLGGSYPENHPILTTPSLFSDNPTYEDMMLLSALLGPAKAPVATEEDVQNAGGLYNVTVTSEPIATEQSTTVDAKLSGLVAIATEDTNTEVNPSRIALEAEHRCLVCLFDFEAEELLRRLGKCGHLYHKDCIDHWLTQGRNSCPLCRGEGVEEKAKVESSASAAEAGVAAA